MPQRRCVPRNPRKAETIWFSAVMNRLTPVMIRTKARIVSKCSSVIQVVPDHFSIISQWFSFVGVGLAER